MKKLLTTSQLAERLMITRQAIYKWRKKGLPVVIDNTGRNGKTIRYDYGEVRRWLNEREKKREKIALEDINLTEIDPYQSG